MGADADSTRRVAALARTRRPGAAREAARLARLGEGEALRRVASQLAAGQRPEVLLDLLPDLQEDDQLELLALLAHELILRLAAYGPDGSLAAGE